MHMKNQRPNSHKTEKLKLNMYEFHQCDNQHHRQILAWYLYPYLSCDCSVCEVSPDFSTTVLILKNKKLNCCRNWVLRSLWKTIQTEDSKKETEGSFFQSFYSAPRALTVILTHQLGAKFPYPTEFLQAWSWRWEKGRRKTAWSRLDRGKFEVIHAKGDLGKKRKYGKKEKERFHRTTF